MNYKIYRDNYLVYEDGRIYSNTSNRFLKPDIVNGYKQVTLFNKDKEAKREKVHRIVAKLFCNNDNNYNVINHIDGDKTNNHYSNLEWCTQKHNNIHAIQTGLRDITTSNSIRWLDDDFRERVSHKISETQIKNKVHAGANNSRYRYQIIYNDKIIQRQELKKIINRSQSYTDVIIKRAANDKDVKILKEYNIKVIDIKKGQSTIEKTSENNSDGTK